MGGKRLRQYMRQYDVEYRKLVEKKRGGPPILRLLDRIPQVLYSVVDISQWWAVIGGFYRSSKRAPNQRKQKATAWLENHQKRKYLDLGMVLGILLIHAIMILAFFLI